MWTNQSQKCNYAKYQVEDSCIFIGNRIDVGTTKEFYDKLDVVINVSDRLVKHSVTNKTTLWFPWNESGIPSIETLYGFLVSLRYYINELKVKNIYIHCDGGTHRAVTLFGFYLRAYHEDALKVNNSYELVGREHWSNPLEYSESYLKENRIIGLKNVLANIKKVTDYKDFNIGLEEFVKEYLPKQLRVQYERERFINQTLPLVLRGFLLDIKFFFKYTLIKGPYLRLNYYIHKKLNTKKGQELKKLGF